MSDQARSSEHTADERAAALLEAVPRAAQTARERIAAAVTDLFRPESYRLSDLQRTLMTRLLGQITGAIEDDLRARLLARPDLPESEELRASLGAAHVEIARPIVERAGLLRDAGLVAVLLRRSEEYRLVGQLRKAAIGQERGLLDGLLSHADTRVAEAAMALLIAESRRNDRFDEPVLARTDLDAELQARLTWRIAAALRDYGVRVHGLAPAGIDGAVAGAAAEALADHDPAATLEACAMRLAGLLDEAGMLTDAALAEALGGGRLALYVAMLAVRAELPFDTAWDLAIGFTGSGCHAVLLRALDLPREAAVPLVIAVEGASGGDDADLARWIEAFAAMSAEEARAAIRPWRFDSGYRTALAELAAGAGR